LQRGAWLAAAKRQAPMVEVTAIRMDTAASG